MRQFLKALVLLPIGAGKIGYPALWLPAHTTTARAAGIVSQDPDNPLAFCRQHAELDTLVGGAGDDTLTSAGHFLAYESLQTSAPC